MKTIWTVTDEDGDTRSTHETKREALAMFGGEVKRSTRFAPGEYLIETKPYAGFDRFYYVTRS